MNMPGNAFYAHSRTLTRMGTGWYRRRHCHAEALKLIFFFTLFVISKVLSNIIFNKKVGLFGAGVKVR